MCEDEAERAMPAEDAEGVEKWVMVESVVVVVPDRCTDGLSVVGGPR